MVTVEFAANRENNSELFEFMFERLGIAQLILLSTDASIGHLVQKLLDCAKFSACFLSRFTVTATIAASRNSRLWKRLVDGRTFEGSDAQPGLLKSWPHALDELVIAQVLGRRVDLRCQSVRFFGRATEVAKYTWSVNSRKSRAKRRTRCSRKV